MIRTTCLALLLAAPLLAQSDSAATLGDRVLVIAPESGYEKLVGRVTATTPDLINLKVDGAVGEFYIQRSQIVAIYRSVARQRRTKRGLLIGVPVGAFAGIWFGPRAGERSYDQSYQSPVFRNALIGGVAGAAIGTVIGFAVRRDVWVPIRAFPR
jgi:hypothetical protein